MNHRQVGRSGLTVSTIGLGCNGFGERLDDSSSTEVLHAALDAGITFFDTADSYGDGASEAIIGRAVAGRRDEVVLATKGGWDPRRRFGPDWEPRLSRRYLMRALEGSLRRLGTDHVDLYQMHMPDGITPIEETLQTLSDMVDAGKVRYIGLGHLRSWEIVSAWWTARSKGLRPFVSVQTEYSVYNRRAEVELLPACAELGVSVIPYFPLAAGLLSGKYRRGDGAGTGRLSHGGGPNWLARADFDLLDDLRAFAEERGIDLPTLAVGGLLARPEVPAVIAGASSPDQVRRNAAAADWSPTAEDLAALEALEARHADRGLTRIFTPGRF